jgi:CAAX protease family protein
MLTPAAAVFLKLLVVTRDGYFGKGWRALGIDRPGFGAWPVALSTPFLVLGFSFGCVWWSGVAEFNLPTRAAGLPSYALDVVVSIVVVTLTGALAEEIGWRGYLLPHLIRFGVLRASLLSGLLHGAWHLPVLLGTSFYHSTGSRLVVVPSFLLTMTLAGVCYAWLRLTTASVWPSAIAHGCFNVLWERFDQCTVARSAETLEYLAGESGLLTVVALAGAAAWFGRQLANGTGG